jgi:hypothetical protein
VHHIYKGNQDLPIEDGWANIGQRHHGGGGNFNGGRDYDEKMKMSKTTEKTINASKIGANTSEQTMSNSRMDKRFQF